MTVISRRLTRAENAAGVDKAGGQRSRARAHTRAWSGQRARGTISMCLRGHHQDGIFGSHRAAQVIYGFRCAPATQTFYVAFSRDL